MIGFLKLNMKRSFNGSLSVGLMFIISFICSLAFILLFLSIHEAFQAGKESFPQSSLILSYGDFSNYIFIFVSSVVVSMSYSKLYQSYILKIIKSSGFSNYQFLFIQLICHWMITLIVCLPVFFPLLLIAFKFGVSQYLFLTALAMFLNLTLFTSFAEIICFFFKKSLPACIMICVFVLSLIHFFDRVSMKTHNPLLKDLFDYLSSNYHFTQVQRGIIHAHDFVYYLGGIIFAYLVHCLIQNFEGVNE